MKKLILFTLLILSIQLSASTNPIAAKYGLTRGNSGIESLNEMTFGPDGILFVADSRGAKIFAIDTQDQTASEIKTEFKVEDFESKVADRLGIERKDIMVHDMAVNPISKNVYVSISLKKQDWTSAWSIPNGLAYAGILLKIDINTKEISEVKLDDIHFSQHEVRHAVSKDSLGKRRSTFMDMKFKDNKLMVAGMSGESFDSKFKVIDFPFADNAETTSLEVFHYIHNAYETWAPINVFDTYEDGGSTKLLAVYYCSPLVTFNLDEFGDGDKVRGETISEIWPGSSRPQDMIIYELAGIDYALVSLSFRGLARFKLDDIKAFNSDLVEYRKTQTTRDDNYHTTKVGVEFKIFGGPVQQMDDYSDAHFMAIQRMENGNLDIRLRQKKYLSAFGD